jgi:hypothetical protein
MRVRHTLRCAGLCILILSVGVVLRTRPPLDPSDQAGAGACTDERLFEWARGHGAFVENIALGEFAFEDYAAPGRHWWSRVRTRRGLMASRDLKQGDVVVAVPEELLFSPQAANRTELREVLHEVPGLDNFAILALFLLQESNKGTASAYWPYVCKMPQSFSTTAFWPLQQVLDAGTDSNVYLMTRRFEAALLQEYNRLMPLLFQLFPTRYSTKTHSFRSWVWAKTCVFSRNWGISDPRAPPNQSLPAGVMSEAWRGHVAYGSFSFVMAPVADLLNHDKGDQGNIAWLHSLVARAAASRAALDRRRAASAALLCGAWCAQPSLPRTAPALDACLGQFASRACLADQRV